MNTSEKYGFAFVALVVGVFLGYLFFHSSGIGAITPSTKTLDSQDLTNELSLIVAPLQAIEQTTTASLAFTAVGTSTAQTTTTAPGLAASLGDIVLVSPVTTSTPGVVFSGSVVTPSTTSATFGISAQLASGTVAITPGASTFSLTVLPKATFIAPTGL